VMGAKEEQDRFTLLHRTLDEGIEKQ
jgi:hypothetical protein